MTNSKSGRRISVLPADLVRLNPDVTDKITVSCDETESDSVMEIRLTLTVEMGTSETLDKANRPRKFARIQSCEFIMTCEVQALSASQELTNFFRTRTGFFLNQFNKQNGGVNTAEMLAEIFDLHCYEVVINTLSGSIDFAFSESEDWTDYACQETFKLSIKTGKMEDYSTSGIFQPV